MTDCYNFLLMLYINKNLPEDIKLSDLCINAVELLRLSGAQLALLYYKYQKIPKNTYGQVSIESFMHYYGFKQKLYIAAIFAPFDDSNDGCFDFEQFILAIASFCLFTRNDMMKQLFRLFDSDGSGYIEMDELESLVEAVHTADPLFPSAVSQAILIFDKNGDGKVDFEEFCAADRTFPMLLWPAFKVQDIFRKETLGLTFFDELMHEIHPELFTGDPSIAIRANKKSWAFIKVYLFCFEPCLQICYDPNWRWSTVLPWDWVKSIERPIETNYGHESEISISASSENAVEILEDDEIKEKEKEVIFSLPNMPDLQPLD